MEKCKICGKNAESEYCFLHKPRKEMKKTVLKATKHYSEYNKTIGKMEKLLEMQLFFLSIWKKRPHKCENCNKSLGNEPLSYMFDHILEKNKYPELTLEKENIWLLCLECHDNKTRSNLNNKMKEKIKITEQIFGK